MKKLNNKGYLLVEIIVAFSIATAFMYIISDITIRVKNRNDDLMARMNATIDQTIIYNTIMYEAYHSDDDHSDADGNTGNFIVSRCSVSGNQFKYNGNVLFTSEYSNVRCSSGGVLISVKNLDANFNVRPHDVNIKKYLEK